MLRRPGRRIGSHCSGQAVFNFDKTPLGIRLHSRTATRLKPLHKTQGPYILLQAKLDMTEYNDLVADAYALPSVGGLPPRPVTQWNTT